MPLLTPIEKKPVYAVCSVSVAPIRKEPKHSSEQISQLLFGERLEILKHVAETDWTHIRCDWDNYEGWCKMGQLRIISVKDFRKATRIISHSHFGRIVCEHAEIWLPMGSELSGIKKGQIPLGDEWGKFRGRKLNLKKASALAQVVLDSAMGYRQAPYQWGGRSLAGIDCSGLIQLAFKQSGVPVPRDACDQATMGEEVHFLSEVLPGDLAFFDNADGQIVHVGILQDEHSIIHATDTSGRVVVDRIDTAGIISVSLKRRTHNLRMLRRVVP